METWRSKALELIPELSEEISEAETPMRLWSEIRLRFEEAYHEPRNEDLIRRIYAYAAWGHEQGERHPTARMDVPTAVATAFYESIPTIPVAREDMPRWFTRQEFLDLKHLFRYLISEDEYQRLLALFPVEGRHYSER